MGAQCGSLGRRGGDISHPRQKLDCSDRWAAAENARELSPLAAFPGHPAALWPTAPRGRINRDPPQPPPCQRFSSSPRAPVAQSRGRIQRGRGLKGPEQPPDGKASRFSQLLLGAVWHADKTQLLGSHFQLFYPKFRRVRGKMGKSMPAKHFFPPSHFFRSGNRLRSPRPDVSRRETRGRVKLGKSPRTGDAEGLPWGRPPRKPQPCFQAYSPRFVVFFPSRK